MPDNKPLLNSQPSQTRFNMGKSMENNRKKKVLVVGAGAAGESHAHSVIPQELILTLSQA